MKRFAVLPLSVAATVLTFSAGAFALDPAPQLKSGNAELTHAIDTTSATKGQIVTAKLAEAIESPQGVKLPRGTVLLGHVDQVEASHDKSPAKLALTFYKAQLKDGKIVAIKATLVTLAPAGTPQASGTTVPSDGTFTQEPGAISGVKMQSAVQEDTSGTLTRRDKNFRLGAGTEMQIAVAPQSGTQVVAAGAQ